jgi:hypothetical protein
MWNKYCPVGQAADGNMAHANFVLATQGYKCTHSSYVILVVFPLQQWLHEHASMLRYMYVACLVIY